MTSLGPGSVERCQFTLPEGTHGTHGFMYPCVGRCGPSSELRPRRSSEMGHAVGGCEKMAPSPTSRLVKRRDGAFPDLWAGCNWCTQSRPQCPTNRYRGVSLLIPTTCPRVPDLSNPFSALFPTKGSRIGPPHDVSHKKRAPATRTSPVAHCRGIGGCCSAQARPGPGREVVAANPTSVRAGKSRLCSPRQLEHRE